MKLFEIPVIKGLFVPFVHLSIVLLGVVPRSRSRCGCVTHHVSLADSKCCVLGIFSMLFLKFELGRLIVRAWTQVLIAICRRRDSYDLIVTVLIR